MPSTSREYILIDRPSFSPDDILAIDRYDFVYVFLCVSIFPRIVCMPAAISAICILYLISIDRCFVKTKAFRNAWRRQ